MESIEYKYNGAKALVKLQGKQLKSFYKTWKKAKLKNVTLPENNDPDCKSLETILLHVLRSSGGYIKWISDKLGIEAPVIDPIPLLEDVQKDAKNYIEHLIEKWDGPLADVEEKRFFDVVYKSNWGVDYCIEAMLEHAVMHPIRHKYQIKKLIPKK